MENILTVIAVTAVAGVGGTGLGGLVACCFRRDSDRTVSLLLSFASGVMLSVVCFDLLVDAIGQHASLKAGVLMVIAGLAAGYILIYFLNDLIDRRTNPEMHPPEEDHPHAADELDELIHFDHFKKHHNEVRVNGGSGKRQQLFIAGVVMACAIALHNLPEGMVIGAAYASDTHAVSMGGSGIILAIVIGLHNIPEGMAVSVPLISGGMKRVNAVLLTAASGVPTVIGAILGYIIGTLGPVALSVSLSFASGAMLYVIFGELLPEAILMWRSKIPSLAVMVGIITGLVIIYA